MGTLTALNILTSVGSTLQDDDFSRWTLAELLGYLNEAQRAVIALKPQASTATVSHQLTAGNTLQDMPADTFRLLNVTRNMGLDGATIGRAIRLASQDTLDAVNPNWHQVIGSYVVHYLYDERDPQRFWVYPQPAAASYVLLTYSRVAAVIDATGDIITVDDQYANALIAYVLMRAFAKDEDYARNLDASNFWGTTFQALMQGRAQAETALNPNNNLGPDSVR